MSKLVVKGVVGKKFTYVSDVFVSVFVWDLSQKHTCAYKERKGLRTYFMEDPSQ